jgi:hypothetical protein
MVQVTEVKANLGGVALIALTMKTSPEQRNWIAEFSFSLFQE